MIVLLFISSALCSEFESQLSQIGQQITSIKQTLEENHIMALYRDLNALQEILNHINREISAIDSTASGQVSHHNPLLVPEAEHALKTTDSIIEKLALLDTKLINIDDKEILDKIEEYVLKMDEVDNYLRKLSRSNKENLDKFEKHIKDTHGHFWIWSLVISSSVLLLISLKILKN